MEYGYKIVRVFIIWDDKDIENFVLCETKDVAQIMMTEKRDAFPDRELVLIEEDCIYIDGKLTRLGLFKPLMTKTSKEVVTQAFKIRNQIFKKLFDEEKIALKLTEGIDTD